MIFSSFSNRRQNTLAALNVSGYELVDGIATARPDERNPSQGESRKMVIFYKDGVLVYTLWDCEMVTLSQQVVDDVIAKLEGRKNV